MPKERKVAVNFPSNFFDEMQEKAQTEEIKRRKVCKDTCSQPELLFLQFKPKGKEDFPSFSNKSYCQPTTSSTNKKPWKPLKVFSNPVTTALSTVAENTKEQLVGLEQAHKENLGNSLSPESGHLKTDCEPTETVNTASSVFNEQQQTEQNADTMDTHDGKHDINDSNLYGYCSELVEESGTLFISSSDRDIEEMCSDPQHTVQVSTKDVKIHDKENVDIEITKLNSVNACGILLDHNPEDTLDRPSVLDENNKEIKDKSMSWCNLLKSDPASSSVNSDDEMTQTNPWLLEKNNFFFYLKSLNFKNSIDIIGTKNKISCNEELTDLNLKLTEINNFESASNLNNFINCQEGSADYISNDTSDSQSNRNLNIEKNSKQVDSHIKVGNDDVSFLNESGDCSNLECKDTSSKRQYVEGAGCIDIDKFMNYNDSEQSNHQGRNKEVAEVNVEIETVTSENSDGIQDKEMLSNKCDKLRTEACEEKLDEINPELSGSCINRYIRLLNSMTENTEFDCYNSLLTQVDSTWEAVGKKNEHAKFDVANMPDRNYFENCLNQNKESSHTEVNEFESVNLQNTNLTIIQKNNKEFEDDKNVLLEDSELSGMKQTNIHFDKQVIKEAYNYSGNLDNNEEVLLNEPMLEKRESKSVWKNFERFQSPCPSTNLYFKNKSMENQVQENIKYKTYDDGNTSGTQFKNTVNLFADNNIKENIENENSALHDEYSCMISNTQLLEIEQQYHDEVVKSAESEFPNNKEQTSKTDSCRTSTVGTQTDFQQTVAAAQHDLPLPFLSSQAQWTKKTQETKRKLRDTIQEIDRLNSILLKVRKELWPQRNIT